MIRVPSGGDTRFDAGPAARDEDVDEAALEQARALLKRAVRPPND